MKSKLLIDWNEVKIGDVADLIMGQSPPGTSYNFDKMGVPLLNGAADFQDKNIIANQFTTKPTKLSKKGDILFCIRATIGKITLSDKEYCLGRGVAAFRVNEKIVNKKFLMKILDNELKNLVLQGSTIKGIRKEDLEKIKISVPSLTVQQKIVSVLEKAEKVKELRKEADELTEDFLKAVFQEMFRNFEDTEILGNHISFLTSGSRGWAKYYSKSGDLFLRIENVGRNQLNTENVAYVTAPNTQEAKRTKVEPGDILLSITADLGRTCVIPFEFPRAFINQHLAILRLDESLDPIFIAQYLTSNKGMSQINKLNKGGTKAGLNFADIRSIKIPMPPIRLQKQFANIVHQYEKIKDYQKQSKEQIHNLLNNMIQKSFKGELTC